MLTRQLFIVFFFSRVKADYDRSLKSIEKYIRPCFEQMPIGLMNFRVNFFFSAAVKWNWNLESSWNGLCSCCISKSQSFMRTRIQKQDGEQRDGLGEKKVQHWFVLLLFDASSSTILLLSHVFLFDSVEANEQINSIVLWRLWSFSFYPMTNLLHFVQRIYRPFVLCLRAACMCVCVCVSQCPDHVWHVATVFEHIFSSHV